MSGLALQELLVLVVSWGTVYCRFIKVPQPVNTTLGATADFHCSATGTPFWYINGRAASPNTDNEINISEPQHMGDSIHSTLTVLASHGKNNSLIQCGVLIIHEHRGLVTSPVQLKVQGLLAAPGNVNGIVLLNTTKVTITWSPPFTLNITGAVAILHYMVYITDNNLRNISCESVNNVQYTFVIEENQCNEYSVQVSAVNTVGEGNKSFPVLLPQPNHNAIKCSGTSSSDIPVVILPSLNIPTGISIRPSSVSLMQGSLSASTSTVSSSPPLCPESNAVGLATWIGSGTAIGCILLFLLILLFGLSCVFTLKNSRKDVLPSEIEMEENEAYQKPALQQAQNLYNMVKNSAYEFTSRHVT